MYALYMSSRFVYHVFDVIIEPEETFRSNKLTGTHDEFQEWLDAIPVHRDGDDCDDD